MENTMTAWDAKRIAKLERRNMKIEKLETALGLDVGASGQARCQAALRQLRGGTPYGGTKAKQVAQYLNLVGYYDAATDTSRWTAQGASRAALVDYYPVSQNRGGAA